MLDRYAEITSRSRAYINAIANVELEGDFADLAIPPSAGATVMGADLSTADKAKWDTGHLIQRSFKTVVSPEATAIEMGGAVRASYLAKKPRFLADLDRRFEFRGYTYDGTSWSPPA